MKKKQGISLIVLVITIISTYNETTKNIQVPPTSIMKVIRKIIYNKESVRIILADFFLYNRECDEGMKLYNKCRILPWKVVKK